MEFIDDQYTSSVIRCADINATVKRHKYIIDCILSAYVVSGCDIVSFFWCEIGKGTLTNVRKSGEKSLNKLGNTLEQEGDAVSQCTTFIASFCGYSSESDMTSFRNMVRQTKRPITSLYSYSLATIINSLCLLEAEI